MNMSTWNQFGGSEVALICLAAIGFMSVVVVIATSNRRIDKIEKTIKARVGNLDPEERVLADK